MARKEGGRCVVRGLRVELRLPKAGMAAESGVVRVQSVRWDARGEVEEEEGVQRGYEAVDVKVMALVGVNACERTARQPLVVGLWVSGQWGPAGEEEVWRLERVLVQVRGSGTDHRSHVVRDAGVPGRAYDPGAPDAAAGPGAARRADSVAALETARDCVRRCPGGGGGASSGDAGIEDWCCSRRRGPFGQAQPDQALSARLNAGRAPAASHDRDGHGHGLSYSLRWVNARAYSYGEDASISTRITTRGLHDGMFHVNALRSDLSWCYSMVCT
nr:hypothetical protein CFP56_03748 [Quercus suber]